MPLDINTDSRAGWFHVDPAWGAENLGAGRMSGVNSAQQRSRCFVAMTSPLLLLSYHDILVVCRAIGMYSYLPEWSMSPQRAGEASKSETPNGCPLAGGRSIHQRGTRYMLLARREIFSCTFSSGWPSCEDVMSAELTCLHEMHTTLPI